jgi:hypothetical protein
MYRFVYNFHHNNFYHRKIRDTMLSVFIALAAFLTLIMGLHVIKCQECDNSIFYKNEIGPTKKAKRLFKQELKKKVTQSKRMNRIDHKRFDMIGPVGPKCLDIEHYGEGDNEKRACGLFNRTAGKTPEQCVIISIGSHNEWGFEEDIFRRTSCAVHTFDCTVNKTLTAPAAISSRVTLHHTCLGKKDGLVLGLEYVSWPTLLASAGVVRAPTFLKMDIEGFEWDVLPSIIAHKNRPLQMAFELHYMTGQQALSWHGEDSPKTPQQIFELMDMLYEKGHYFVVDRHDNEMCEQCSELLVSRVCTKW